MKSYPLLVLNLQVNQAKGKKKEKKKPNKKEDIAIEAVAGMIVDDED